MEKGWEATGLLEGLWGRVGGRDRLAELTGIQRGTLSGYNTGRLPLGAQNAEKIAAALDVSVLELGAPKDAVGPREATLFDRLQALEATVEEQGQEMTRALRALAKEVRALGPGRARAAQVAKRGTSQAP